MKSSEKIMRRERKKKKPIYFFLFALALTFSRRIIPYALLVVFVYFIVHRISDVKKSTQHSNISTEVNSKIRSY